MRLKIALLTLLVAVAARAETPAAPDLATFYNATAGHYQVLAQSGRDRAWQVNQFMNQMLGQYSRYFANWSLKDGARVIVFNNPDDFRAYAAGPIKRTTDGLTGFCYLKTDEAGNTFYELVTFEHEQLWQVLAHEGFHQFLGYELGLQVPVWLNEGMAQYFETSYVENSRLHTGSISQRKLRAAQYFIRTGAALAVGDLQGLDRAGFYDNAQLTYPMSWALVYYLINRDTSTFSSSTFRRYLLDLKYNYDPITSFQRRFGRTNGQWQHDFEQFILQLRAQAE